MKGYSALLSTLKRDHGLMPISAVVTRLTPAVMRAAALASVVTFLATASSAIAAPPIELVVDARDVTHGIQHAHLVIPVVRAGPLTLAYPEWIPGEHRPNGPITQIVNLTLEANGRSVMWKRDRLDAFLFHVDVPPGAQSIEVRFDYVSPSVAFGAGFGKTPNETKHLLILLFNQLLLYPADEPAAAVEIKPSVRLPDGWQFDGALPPERVQGGLIAWPAVSLSILVDSPLLAGQYLRTITLSGTSDKVRMTLAAEKPSELTVPDNLLSALRRLPAETSAVFGAGHYRRYVWLTSLSDRLAHDGLEHHESADVRESEALFTAARDAIDWTVFPHEYVHSWNGKYRRPDGLATRNYQQPMATDLLWVYEGLTRYYGDFVLSARSGLTAPDEARAYLAFVAAQMSEDRPGRGWRSLADTATSVPAFADAPAEWIGLRRGADYYNEMLLIWLEADVAIRRATGRRRSLDDVCAAFFSGPERAPAIRPYSRADVIEALGAAAPMDWKRFFTQRIDQIAPRAPLGGLSASGWTLTYDDRPNPFVEALEAKTSLYDLSHSLGIWVRADGTIQDVVPGSAAFEAGAAPGSRWLAINGHPFAIAEARAAIVRAETAPGPIDLVVRSDDTVRDLRVNYHRGLRNPHLTRDPATPDLLHQIMAPRMGVLSKESAR